MEELQHRSPTPPPQASAGRPQRLIRRLNKFKDFWAHSDGRLIGAARPPAPRPEPLTGAGSTPVLDPPLSPTRGRLHSVFNRWKTGRSTAGLYREYLYQPSYIPDLPDELPTTTHSTQPPSTEPSSDGPDNSPSPTPQSQHSSPPSSEPITDATPACFPTPTVDDSEDDPEAPLKGKLGPLPNFTSFLQAHLHWCKRTSTASDAHAQDQINILSDPRFGGWKVEHAKAVDIPKFKKLLASWLPDAFKPHKGWKTASVVIDVPLGDGTSEPFEVPGLHYRSIVEILERVVKADPNRKSFHLHPFREYIQRDDEDAERVIQEAFSCDAVIEAYEALNKLPPEPTPSGGVCELERVIFFIRIWSDATLLTNFGSTSLWPIYICWANQSKYQHYRKGCHAIHDIAHIPKASLLAHCELSIANFYFFSYHPSSHTSSTSRLGESHLPLYSRIANASSFTQFG